MSEPKTNDNASTEVTPEMELAELEQAMKSEAGEAKTEAQTEFEQLAAKKGWNSPDDLAKAYQELESKLTPQSRELKELREMVKEIRESTKKPEVDPLENLPDEQKEAISLLERLIEKKLSPLYKQVETQEADRRIKAVKGQFPEASDAEIDQALNLMERYHTLPLEDAIKIASYEKVKKGATANQKKAATAQQQKRAFAEGASDARKSDDNDYSKMTIEELESIIPR